MAKVKGSSSKRSKDKIMHNSVKANNPDKESYKDQLLEINDMEKKYDALFDQKLSNQFREFRNIKEHTLQAKKFLRVFMILLTIILLALLLLSFSMH